MLLLCKCLYLIILEFCFVSNRRWNFFGRRKPINQKPKSVRILLFSTICFGTRADESLTKLYLKGVFSTNFKITDLMTSPQSALNFLVFSGNKFNSFKAVCAPTPISILIKSCNCLYQSTNLSLAFFLYLQRQPLNPFCRLHPTIWEKSFLGHQREMGSKEHHFGKQSNSSQIWRQFRKKMKLAGYKCFCVIWDQTLVWTVFRSFRFA